MNGSSTAPPTAGVFLAARPEDTLATLYIARDVLIAAPLQGVWDATLEQLGPAGDMPDGSPFPMTLEPWPGGRWFRDLGGNSGHLWAHVQVVKPPRLLELCGPLFMSYPAISHVAYRLTPEGNATRLSILHRAVGLIPAEHREGVVMGWEHELRRIAQRAGASGR